jgi:hypothetical protein
MKIYLPTADSELGLFSEGVIPFIILSNKNRLNVEATDLLVLPPTVLPFEPRASPVFFAFSHHPKT